MRKNAVLAIFKKEFRTLLRDKKTLITMFGMPLVLYPVLIIAISSIVLSMETKLDTATYRLAVSTEDAQVTEFLTREPSEGEPGFVIVDAKNGEELLENGEADVLLLCGGDGYTVVSQSSRKESQTAADYLVSRLKDYRDGETRRSLEEKGIDSRNVLEPFTIEEKDIASDEQAMGSALGGVIPLLLIMGVFLGVMQPAIDITAGERERNTQETLMTFPVTGREMIAGKFLLVSLCGLVSALLYLVTVTILGLYLISMVGSVSGEAVTVNLASFLPSVGVMLLAVIAFALFLGAAFMCVCSFAKSTKEAGGYTSPLIFIIMMTAYSGMLDIHLTRALSIVPVLNIVLLIKSVFVFEYDLPAILLVLISNMAYAALAIVILGKLYTSERVLFGEGGTSLLERPGERVPGTLPGIGDGVITLLVSLVFYLYLGSLFQVKLGIWGLGLTQLLLLAVPVFMAWFGRTDLKAVFSLRKPGVSQVFASVLLGIGSFLTFNILVQLITPMDSESMEVYTEAMEELMSESSLAAELLVVGLAPAICEEGLFRGYLSSSLKKLHPVLIALITSLIFGFYHMNLFQGIYAFFMGLILSLAVQKTGSIFCGSVIHLTANSVSVLLAALAGYAEEGTLSPALLRLWSALEVMPALPFLGIGVLLLAAGGFWMKKTVHPFSQLGV